jgi:hypothetical protein
MADSLLRGCLLLAALAVLSSSSPAEVVKLRELSLFPARAWKISTATDPGVKSASVISPSGDLLSFVAKDTGAWELRRLRNWAKSPVQDWLVLHGFFTRKDRPNLTYLRPFVYVTSNGLYAICAAAAMWRNRQPGHPMTEAGDAVVSVVDLSAFKVVATAHTRELGLFALLFVYLDHEDYVLVNSTEFVDNHYRSILVRLSVPTLSAGPVCSYGYVGELSNEHEEVTTADTCQAAVGPRFGFEEYRKREMPTGTELFPSYRQHEPSLCASKELSHGWTQIDESCHWYKLTDDGKFGIVERSRTSLNTILDSYSAARPAYIAFSTVGDSPIGEISVRKGSLPVFQFAYRDGRDYLLVIEDGTFVTVYELRN